MQRQQTYSFTDVNCTITGPGGNFGLGSGAGSAEEGISISVVEELDSMKIGADGQVAHSLHASRAGKIVVRLLKTSPVNAQLATMCAQQQQSSTQWARNTLVITNVATGDNISCQNVAFVKIPDLNWAKEAGNNEWEFNSSQVDYNLGSGMTA